MDTSRFVILMAGLIGAAGVALSAIASHAGGTNVATAANFMLLHAPVLLAIGLFGHSRVLKLGAAALLIGLTLFCGDLLVRHYAGWRMFPMAAPAGGLLLIGGWLIVALSALTMPRR
mgnify:CR=1 FL=1